jgi:serine/threonine protein kinase
MDTKSAIARFEAERQALAMMDHPNIARVFDAGATETGRPYFVMELVTGVSITEYCDKNNLSTKERLALFIQVCNAVQHAHQKGIIHRDVKPTNVMVTHHAGKPIPKVIDFGIAKAINQKLTEKTLFTRYAHIVGTPAYMSPEQAEPGDLDIDTRSDIYSLGVRYVRSASRCLDSECGRSRNRNLC